MARIAFVPMPIEWLSHEAKLDDQVARQVLGFDLAAFFPPNAEQSVLVITHDDAGIGAADEESSISAGGDCVNYHEALLWG